LRLFSFGGYGLALAALALVDFGAHDSYPRRAASDPVPSLPISRIIDGGDPILDTQPIDTPKNIYSCLSKT